MDSKPSLADRSDPSSLPPVRRLSEDLRSILEQANGQALTVAELEQVLQGRGFALFIFLLSAPFIIPTPGLSVPFGIGLSLLGLRIASGQKPSLPQFILNRRLSYKTLHHVITPIARIVERLEKRVRPRMHFLQTHPMAINLIGVGIMSGGLVLSLPLPIPFSNAFPAISVMLLAAGMMERDGLLVLWGYCMGLGSWIYLAFWWKLIVKTFSWIWPL